MKAFIVISQRWGDPELHSYIVGCYKTDDKAIEVAEEHCTYRGGKYACVVFKCEMNFFDNDQYPEEIYRAKSAYEQKIEA